MEKKERLIKYHKTLCDVLNENGIKNKWDDKEFDWKVDEFDPYTKFLGGIYSNGRAFNFLKENGYLDQGICPACGHSPIDKTYTYRSGLSSDRYFYICINCSNEGSKSSIYHSAGKKSGCYIATVCYGDYDANEVMALRAFRDNVLTNYFFGEIFIKTYYFFSPSFAKWLINKKRLNSFIRVNILDRIVKIIFNKIS